MEEEQRQREEEERRSKHYDSETEYDEDGNQTTTVSPRSISYRKSYYSSELIQRMSGAQRENIFHKIEDLVRDAMNELSQANDLADNLVEVDVRAGLMAILSECIVASSGGPYAGAVACGYCAIEIGYHMYYKYPEYKEAKRLVERAKRKFDEAARLEEMLWYDDDAEDWM